MSLAGQTIIMAAILDINTAQILSASTVTMRNMAEVFTMMPGLVRDIANNLSRPIESSRTIAISPFDVRGGLSATDADVIMELLIAQLVTNGVKVVDRNSFDKITTQMNFQSSDWSDSNKVAQLGRALNANSILRGSIMTLAGQTVITASILDINTAEIVSASTLQMNGTGEIFSKLPLFVKDISDILLYGSRVPENMVRINGGTFTMGSPSSESGRDIDEGPQHQVTVSSFFMGKYEVTQREYQAIIGTNPSNFRGDNLPVENVSWYDAVEYCNRLSQREGLTPAYTISGTNVTWNRNANGYRLPTEAEWEYACRAGTTSEYNTGPSIRDDTGWYSGNSGGRTHPVGEKPPNAWGLYDMHGNVWEWCWDWHGNYSTNAQTDPMGASSGSIRVLRGGWWGDAARGVRSAGRDFSTPSYRSEYVGFRVVRPLV
jgi:formylglycine-generating enzyme required for sulfatase activity